MKATLTKIIQLLNKIEETSNDDEFTYCVNEAVLQLESAADRLTAIDEELEAEADQLEDSDQDDEPIACPWERASAVALADDLLAACEENDRRRQQL